MRTNTNVLYTVKHAQRQIGKVLTLYFALVRGLNQYLEKRLESLLNMLMVKLFLVSLKVAFQSCGKFIYILSFLNLQRQMIFLSWLPRYILYQLLCLLFEYLR